jgi:large subunit ribosomal protein L22
MGIRKKEMADTLKEKRRNTYYAKLNNCPTSPRKMRLVADLIRGQEVSKALNILKYTQKEAAGRLEKLLSSAIANYESKSGQRADEGNLFVTEIKVDSGFQMKRLRPAPQGRAYRIRKRSNHVTVVVNTIQQEEQTQE